MIGPFTFHFTGGTGAGVPQGGAVGQYLAKSAVADYATSWTDFDATLAAVSNLDLTSGDYVYATGADQVDTDKITANSRLLLRQATFADWRTNLNLTIGTDVQAYSAGLDVYSANPLTAVEIQQLQNIDAQTISNAQWGYVGNLNQNLRTTDDVEFTRLKVGVDTIDTNLVAVFDKGDASQTLPIWNNTDTLLIKGPADSNNHVQLYVDTETSTNRHATYSFSTARGRNRSIIRYTEPSATLGTLAIFAPNTILYGVDEADTSATDQGHLFSGHGVVIGSPNGGNQGVGSLNAAAIYDDGALICTPLHMDVPEAMKPEYWDALVEARPEYTSEIRTVQIVSPTVTDRIVKWFTLGLVDPKIKVTKEVQIQTAPPTRKNRTARRFLDMVFKEGFDPRDPKNYVARMEKDRAVPGLMSKKEFMERGLNADPKTVKETKEKVVSPEEVDPETGEVIKEAVTEAVTAEKIVWPQIDKQSNTERAERTALALDCLAVAYSNTVKEVERQKTVIGKLEVRLKKLEAQSQSL